MMETYQPRASSGSQPLPSEHYAGIVPPLPAPDRPKLPSRFLARQPILDLKQKLHGYSMLQRAGVVADTPDVALDPAEATRQTVQDYLLFMPDSSGEKVFATCNREALTSGMAEWMPAQNTVLQIPASLELDADIVTICQGLRKKGYRFALECAARVDAKHPLLDLAEYLMINFQTLDREARREIYSMAKGSKAKLVAQNVEKTEELAAARREGCQFFQGFFLSSSAIAARRTIPINQVICLRLMAALSEANIEIKQIESMVLMDTSLCYQLLRRVNSVMYSLNTRITSIRSALVFVGNDEFRKLVSIALADVFASTQSKTLITVALERAKFCEILAPRLHERGPKLYLLGMLSLIDLILQVPMSQVMESIPIDADMKLALQGEQSNMGLALELVRSYQAANWERCEMIQKKLDMSESVTSGTYMESVHWASLVLRD